MRRRLRSLKYAGSPFTFTAIAVAVIVVVGAGCGKRGTSGTAVNLDGPLDFTLPTPVDGETVTLSDLRGSVVLLDFWATWCGPCIAAMPSVQRLSDDYAERGVRIFGVNVWESGDPAEFMRDNGYTYGLLLKGDDVAADLNVNGIPTFFLIGVDGEIIARHVGGGPDAMNSIRPILDAYLEKHDM